ncbi:hypothetical protein OHB26_05745 [Nocardia sp. NBC_01503]|uniref:TY-Chap domain-containing protein n=1 Tax=Nocardia sp. NBC_01503 TaxID=2975997 RepID=UPI002E7B8978|nr:hypothetical protein [Nocardia sp. NBC_01503]WTL33727.1 hypothetical protein OHB26_05745 [Nocardia sp. NBC_01503]
MTNAYYHMQLEVTLSAAVTSDEIEELRWHLRLGPHPMQPLRIPVADEMPRFYRGPAHHHDQPGLAVALSPRERGGWTLTAWQEPDPDELDRLEPLFRWLAAKSDPAVANSDGSVLLGHVRFSDEADWTHGLLIHEQRLHYPRVHARPASESMVDSGSAVTTWDNFAARLQLTLGQIRDGDWIRVGTTGNRHACFFGDSRGVTICNIVANTFLEIDWLITEDDEVTIRRLGWNGPRDGYWDRHLRPPVTLEQCRDVADATVSALRDVLKVSSPQELLLSACSEHVGEQPDTSAMGMKLSPWR